MALATPHPHQTTLAASLRRLSSFLMIFKTPAPRMATEKLHLSCLDQRTVRVYTQTLIIFPFPDGDQTEAAISAVTDGLREALKTFPFLAGTLSLSDDQSGKLTLTYPNEVSDLTNSRLFHWKVIPLSKFGYSYEQLKKAGMPPHHFTPEVFLPDDLLNYPGIPPSGEGIVDFSRSSAPAFRFQANFIPGGLVLSMYFHHTLMDCSGINTFWKHLAGEISSASRGPGEKRVDSPVTDLSPDQSELRRRLDELAPATSLDTQPSADAYTDGVFTYDKTLEENAPCELRYLVIPASTMRDYRDNLKQYFPRDSPPSICNVLAALLWIHVTRARVSRVGSCKCREQQGCEHKRTNIGIATDLRKRRDPHLSSDYMGNLALFSKGTLSIADITAEDRVTDLTIVAAVREIQRTIAQVNNEWVENHLAFFKSIKQIKSTECGLLFTPLTFSALGFKFGFDLYITSWMNFAADLQWNIPGTDLDENSLHGRADYIRRTYGPSDGGMMIMPRRRSLVNGMEAPYEIMVRLAAVDMKTLLAEEGGISKWCQRVI
ncbi:hypothetical protein K458DRAFT_355283 [Lentithecium fluviatile CBS 122367]|uniref:Trichothecene 3-O-acetyltransferase-like N-terminal domain-containing protein n=1 Tax=Lentithecium fluviatile CBS 122367 TaxID=1168545 RepID=A0A6G1JLB7_9PLEO|nr:hypothetical protein K458DRAFT_355283 [Lentithecium fluviatile CBS 122367]